MGSVWLYCTLKQKFLCVVIPAQILIIDDLELYCYHCKHFHLYTVTEEGNLRVSTY